MVFSQITAEHWHIMKKYGFWGMIILMCWQQIGYMMIIYIAGIQNIPGDLIEAAEIDGATSWQVLKKCNLTDGNAIHYRMYIF